MTILIVECGWCGKYLGQKDGKGVSGISHGICPECSEKFFNEFDKITEKELNEKSNASHSQPQPVRSLDGT
jgi:hypothetical protein